MAEAERHGHSVTALCREVIGKIGKFKQIALLGEERFEDQSREKFGAGEGIRTLDPDLGKVVLYP